MITHIALDFGVVDGLFYCAKHGPQRHAFSLRVRETAYHYCPQCTVAMLRPALMTSNTLEEAKEEGDLR